MRANEVETAGSPSDRQRQFIAFLTIWLLSINVILAGAAGRIHPYSRNKRLLVSVIVSFALQLALYWLPGFPALRQHFEVHFKRRSRALVAGAALFVCYVVYGAGSWTWGIIPMLKLVCITAIVLGVYSLFPPQSQALSWQDVAVMLGITVPLYVGWYRDIWPAPVYLDVMARTFVVSLAAFSFLSLRLLPDVGYEWRLQTNDWVEGGKQLAYFSLIAIPLGFGMRFIAWHPRKEGILGFFSTFVGIFLFIAVAEELFFRGVLQNLLEKSMAGRYAPRGVASAIFGLSHIHHGFPNWRYVIMAAIAGWFYGTAWHNRRSIVASSITHAAVDTLWRHFFLV